MTINLIPYGQLPSGNFGINVDNTTGDPIGVALEVKDTLPAVGDPLNFVGRLVFAKDTVRAYVYVDTPVPFWDPLEGIPAEVGAVAGNPPTVPTPQIGSLFWDTDTEVLFVWDGLEWQAAGGRYATVVVERHYTAPGATATFPLGTASAPLAIHVEAFLDGVRQISSATNPGSPDYFVVGTNIIFSTPPSIGVEILTRSFETIQIAQTAEAFDAFITATPGQTDFDTMRTDVQSEAMIVTVNGAMQVLGVDYTVTQADTTIVSLTKGFAAATEATITTTALHGIVTLGTVIELAGFAEPEGQNVKYSVSAIDSPTVVRIAVDATEFVAGGTGNPIGYFTPSFISNKVVFSPSPFIGGENVYIKMFKGLITAPITGEANILGLIPSAVGQDISGPKAGSTLQVKGLLAGTNISITDNGDDLVVASSTGAAFENRQGTGGGGNYLTPGAATSYVGVGGTPSFPVTVDMGVSAFSPPYTGPGDPNAQDRRIVVKDEGGNAGTNNITITGPVGALYEGNPTYTINVNRGAVTLVFDGTNWHITSEYP